MAVLRANPTIELYDGGRLYSDLDNLPDLATILKNFPTNVEPSIRFPLRSRFVVGSPANSGEYRAATAGFFGETPAFYVNKLILPLYPIEWIAPEQGFFGLKVCDADKLHGAVISSDEKVQTIGVGSVDMFNLLNVIKINYTHGGINPKGKENISTQVFHNGELKTLDKIGEEAEFSLNDLRRAPVYFQIGIRKFPIFDPNDDKKVTGFRDVLGRVIKVFDSA